MLVRTRAVGQTIRDQPIPVSNYIMDKEDGWPMVVNQPLITEWFFLDQS